MTPTEKEQMRELNHKDRRARTYAKLSLEEAAHSGGQMQALIPILVNEFKVKTYSHEAMIGHVELIEQEARRILEAVLRAKRKVQEGQGASEQATELWKHSKDRIIGKLINNQVVEGQCTLTIRLK